MELPGCSRICAITTFDDGSQLLRLVEALTDNYEAERPAPWAANDAPEDFVATQLQRIVDFSIEITGVEGKRKAQQNRSVGDRMHMTENLAADAQDMCTFITDRD